MCHFCFSAGLGNSRFRISDTALKSSSDDEEEGPVQVPSERTTTFPVSVLPRFPEAAAKRASLSSSLFGGFRPADTVLQECGVAFASFGSVADKDRNEPQPHRSRSSCSIAPAQVPPQDRQRFLAIPLTQNYLK